MEVKKARRADLEKGKSRWLFMGLIVTLSFMFVSFEWTERNVTYAISDLVSDPDFFEELVPVTYNQDKPLPPPPPPAPRGQQVDPVALELKSMYDLYGQCAGRMTDLLNWLDTEDAGGR